MDDEAFVLYLLRKTFDKVQSSTMDPVHFFDVYLHGLFTFARVFSLYLLYFQRCILSLTKQLHCQENTFKLKIVCNCMTIGLHPRSHLCSEVSL